MKNYTIQKDGLYLKNIATKIVQMEPVKKVLWTEDKFEAWNFENKEKARQMVGKLETDFELINLEVEKDDGRIKTGVLLALRELNEYYLTKTYNIEEKHLHLFDNKEDREMYEHYFNRLREIEAIVQRVKLLKLEE